MVLKWETIHIFLVGPGSFVNLFWHFHRPLPFALNKFVDQPQSGLLQAGNQISPDSKDVDSMSVFVEFNQCLLIDIVRGHNYELWGFFAENVTIKFENSLRLFWQRCQISRVQADSPGCYPCIHQRESDSQKVWDTWLQGVVSINKAEEVARLWLPKCYKSGQLTFIGFHIHLLKVLFRFAFYFHSIYGYFCHIW